jgi:hypothetical protein
MRPFFEKHVLQQQPFKPMIIVVDTTKAGSASNTFVLPIFVDATETAYADWGDGFRTSLISGNNTHVYAASGVYTIKIYSKIFWGVYFSNGGDKAKITQILSWGDGIFRNAITAFNGCTNLTFIAPNIKLLATSVQSMHQSNTGLLAAPNYSMTRVTNTSYMYASCSSIQTAAAINMSKVTNAANMHQGNIALTSIPFYDLSSATNVSFMFQVCSSVKTVPLLNLSSVTNATSFLQGVTLTTASYSDFLVHLATLPLQSAVTFHGGNSKYNTAGGVARAYLISNFGWTITDGGAAP